MRQTRPRGLTAGASALALGLLFAGVATAQDVPAAPSQSSGLIIGMVARCVTGVEQPAVGVAVGLDGGAGNLVRTDSGGQFALALPPGQYTVVATADDGTAIRPYVAVEAGAALDIGVLDIGGGFSGCGPEADSEPSPAPTVAPTAIPDVATATPVPTALPSPTPTPPAEPASGSGSAG